MFIYDCLSLKILEINESSYFSLIDIRIVVKQPFEIFFHNEPTIKVNFKCHDLLFFPKII